MKTNSKKLGISFKEAQRQTTINRQIIYRTKQHSDETKRILPVIDKWIENNLKRLGKQKHTAVRIYERLFDEYDFKGRGFKKVT